MCIGLPSPQKDLSCKSVWMHELVWFSLLAPCPLPPNFVLSPFPTSDNCNHKTCGHTIRPSLFSMIKLLKLRSRTILDGHSSQGDRSNWNISRVAWRGCELAALRARGGIQSCVYCCQTTYVVGLFSIKLTTCDISAHQPKITSTPLSPVDMQT